MFMTAQEVAMYACMASKKHLKPGISESHFAEICEELMYSLGAEELWYPMLVNFNSNSRYCTRGSHLPSKDIYLLKSDIVLVDFSPKVQGLWGDYSETIVIGEDNIFTRIVEDAKIIFEETYDYAKSCKTIGELFTFCNELIDNKGYTLLDPNGNIGHSIENYNNQDKRVYICPDNNHINLSGKKWAIEPHIGEGNYGAKFENVIDR
jgi:methionine aminopeptidase